jgi:hypothetical protein
MDREHSCTETVEGAARALERVDDVEGGDGLALCVLSVGDGVADDLEEEDESATVPEAEGYNGNSRSRGRS